MKTKRKPCSCTMGDLDLREEPETAGTRSHIRFVTHGMDGEIVSITFHSAREAIKFVHDRHQAHHELEGKPCS